MSNFVQTDARFLRFLFGDLFEHVQVCKACAVRVLELIRQLETPHRMDVENPDQPWMLLHSMYNLPESAERDHPR